MIGETGFVERFMATAERNPAVKAYFAEKDIRPKDPRSLRRDAS